MSEIAFVTDDENESSLVEVNSLEALPKVGLFRNPELKLFPGIVDLTSFTFGPNTDCSESVTYLKKCFLKIGNGLKVFMLQGQEQGQWLHKFYSLHTAELEAESKPNLENNELTMEEIETSLDDIFIEIQDLKNKINFSRRIIEMKMYFDYWAAIQKAELKKLMGVHHKETQTEL